MARSTMRDIKRRINSVSRIDHITGAMRLVSAAKLKRLKTVYEESYGNLRQIENNIYELCGSMEELPKGYIAGDREIKRTCYIVFTGNRNLAGSYNTNIYKTAEKETENDMAAGKEAPLFVCIGGKGQNYFSQRGCDILSEHLTPPENMSFLDIRTIIKPVIELFNKEEIDEITVIYTIFVSPIEQRAKVEKLLPFEPAEKEGQDEKMLCSAMELEPGPDEVFDYLVPRYLEAAMYRTLLEAAICEQAARRAAMQNASDNARQMIEEFKSSYNSARQSAITIEISEIVNTADAMK